MQFVKDLLSIIVFSLLYLLLLVGSIYALIEAMCDSEKFGNVQLWRNQLRTSCLKIERLKRSIHPGLIAFFGIMNFLSCKIEVKGHLVTFLYLALVAGFAAYLYSLYGQYTSDDGFSQMEQIQLIVGVIFLLVMCCVNVFSLIRYKPHGEGKDKESKNYIYGSLLGMISSVFIKPIKNNFILLSLGAIMVFGIFKGWFSSKITFDSAEKVGYAITFMMGLVATIFGITLIIDNLDVLSMIFDKICLKEKPKSTHRVKHKLMNEMEMNSVANKYKDVVKSIKNLPLQPAHKPTKPIKKLYKQDGGGGRKRSGGVRRRRA